MQEVPINNLCIWREAITDTCYFDGEHCGEKITQNEMPCGGIKYEEDNQ